MRMSELVFLGLFFWTITSIVHAQFAGWLSEIGEPRIQMFVCKEANDKCTYSYHIVQNGEKQGYKIGPTDCNSAQSNGYTFTRALDDSSFQVQSPCSAMSIDTLKKYSQYKYNTCMPFVGPICRNPTTTT